MASMKQVNETVLVGCKIPTGLVMQCYVMREGRMNVLGIPGQEVPVMRSEPDPSFQKITLKGPAVPYGVAPQHDIKGGYGFTEVPRAAWERWTRPGQPGPDLVRSKMVICGATRDEAIGIARDLKGLKSGLQPLAQEADPRFRKARSEIAVEKAVVEE